MGIIKDPKNTHLQMFERVPQANIRKHSFGISFSEASLLPSPRQSLLQLKESSSFSRSRTTLKTSLLKRDTKASETASAESGQSRVSLHTGEATWPMLFVTSQRRLLTSHAKTRTRNTSAHTTPRPSQASSSSETVLQVEQLVPRHCASSTHLILQELVSPLMLDLARRENSPVL